MLPAFAMDNVPNVNRIDPEACPEFGARNAVLEKLTDIFHIVFGEFACWVSFSSWSRSVSYLVMVVLCSCCPTKVCWAIIKWIAIPMRYLVFWRWLGADKSFTHKIMNITGIVLPQWELKIFPWFGRDTHAAFCRERSSMLVDDDAIYRSHSAEVRDFVSGVTIDRQPVFFIHSCAI
jgi:hypothetical protein